LLGEYDVSEISVDQNGHKITVKKGVSHQVAAGAAMPGDQTEPPGPVDADEISSQMVIAPMVGLFRHTKPALSYGSVVERGQPVGMIESMKLMNDVLAEIGGTVVEVLIEEGSPVEFGQPLFRLSQA
jgi:biotin carboxyl carrier protein